MYSKQHKRKALLTRISSILLSATIAFTSLPVTNVYADTGVKDTAQNEGNKTQGGSTNQAESVGESVYGADIYQGYRMYMIEPTQLKRITDLYDFTYNNIDRGSLQSMYFETRFDYGETASIEEGTAHTYSISDLKDWCVIPGKTEQGQGGYLDVPTPINGLKAQGGKFKNWFLNGINTGTTVNPGGGGLIYNPNANNSNINSGGSTSPGGNKEIKEDPPQPPVVAKPTDKIELGDSLYDGDFDYSDVIDYYGIEVKPVASGITSDIAGIGQQAAYDQAYKTALLEAEQKAKKVAMSIRDRFKATYNKKVKYYGNNYRSMSLNECKLAALADIKGNVNNATGCETVRTIVYRYLYNYCDLNETDIYTVSKSSSTALYINNNSDLLSTNIPLANEDFSNATQLQLNSPAFCLLNQSEYIVIKDEYKEAYGDTAAKCLQSGCLLVVEPLVMLYEMHQPGINDFARSCLKKYYYNKRSYGSVYNIIEHWGGSEVHTYVPRLTNLLPNSLVTTNTFNTSSGYSIVGVDANADFYATSAKRMSGLKERLKTVTESGGNIEGIAMHIYDASMLGGNPSTSTYDELNGSLPNKSEDCTSKPEESSYTTTSKQVSIIKSYETVKSDGTIQNDGYYIRQNTPHTITIEDEDEINYKVVDWQTSSENNIPYGLTEASSGGKNYTYEQLVQSSNKLQSGTSAGNTVALTETEKILYVKLQKQEAPTVQNTRLTGDYILNESELAKAFQITPISIEYTFPKISFSESRGCGGHYNHRDTDGDGIDDDYDTCGGASSSSGYISDSKATVTLKNESESSYSNIIVQSDKAKFKSDMTVAELNRGTNADSFNTSANHKYTFNVYRYQQGEQNLTLCKYWQKQSSNKDVSVGTTQTIAAGNKDIAKTLGYSEASSKSTKSRAEIDYIVNAVKFKFIFDKANSPDKSTSYYLHGDGCSCGGVHVGGYSRGKDIDTATTVESEADISVQVYSGTTSKPVHTKLWTETIGRNGEKYLPIRDNNNKTVGRQVQSTSTVKFNPFM